MHVRLIIEGKPADKQHKEPILNRRRQMVGMRQPDSVHTYENSAKTQIEGQLHAGYVMPPVDEPLSVRIDMMWPMPESWSAKKKANHAGSLKTSKPDADNMCKAILDTLNGLVFVDDSQVHPTIYRWWTHAEQVETWIEIQSFDVPPQFPEGAPRCENSATTNKTRSTKSKRGAQPERPVSLPF